MEGPYLSELKRSAAGLRFRNRRVESEYQAYAAARHSKDLRFQLLLAALLICALCLFDFVLLAPDYYVDSIALRCTFMLPPILVMLGLTGIPGARRYLQPAGVVVGLAVGLTSLVIGWLGSRYDTPRVFGGYQVIIVFIYFFLGLRVPLAVATGSTLFAAFVATLYLAGAPHATVAYNALFIAFLNVIGALGCYQLSRARRAVFLEERILSYRANHDALTQLPNRRAFDELLQTAWENAGDRGKPLALLMMDIDHFKSYNDLYGHQAGDRAIAAVAGILGNSLQRPQDFAGRYGGEEFVVLLFDANREFARKMAEQIREAVLAQDIEHRGSAAATRVSISVGLAWLEPSRSTHSVKGFLQMADEALYAAKARGRNCVVDADPDAHTTKTGVFRIASPGETSASQNLKPAPDLS